MKRKIDSESLPLKNWKKEAAMFQDDYTAGAGTSWLLNVAKAENKMIWEMILAIEEALTLTPPNEWVSVEERLPPEHEPVLCIVNGKPKPNITLEEAYQLGSWNKADGWIIDEYLDWEDAVVLWWMPLPEPPGKEG